MSRTYFDAVYPLRVADRVPATDLPSLAQAIGEFEGEFHSRRINVLRTVSRRDARLLVIVGAAAISVGCASAVTA